MKTIIKVIFFIFIFFVTYLFLFYAQENTKYYFNSNKSNIYLKQTPNAFLLFPNKKQDLHINNYLKILDENFESYFVYIPLDDENNKFAVHYKNFNWDFPLENGNVFNKDQLNKKLKLSEISNQGIDKWEYYTLKPLNINVNDNSSETYFFIYVNNIDQYLVPGLVSELFNGEFINAISGHDFYRPFPLYITIIVTILMSLILFQTFLLIMSYLYEQMIIHKLLGFSSFKIISNFLANFFLTIMLAIISFIVVNYNYVSYFIKIKKYRYFFLKEISYSSLILLIFIITFICILVWRFKNNSIASYLKGGQL